MLTLLSSYSYFTQKLGFLSSTSNVNSLEYFYFTQNYAISIHINGMCLYNTKVFPVGGIALYFEIYSRALNNQGG